MDSYRTMIEEMRGNVMDLQGEGWKVLAGSCLDRLPELADESVDAIVCDPPYELGFMGKSWDSSGIAYDVNVWKECLRVLKPGGHVLAFGGSRTWHRLAVAIEDAGFELRDSIAWLYGSGFPKSLDVSKAIDKAAGVEREVIGGKIKSANRGVSAGASIGGESGGYNFQEQFDVTVPATDDAKKWQGWGTALKPAFEPVVVGRKPLKGTVAANVLAYGVGGLNIDATRIGTEERTNQAAGSLGNGLNMSGGLAQEHRDATTVSGRWPSNVILDEYTAQLVDQQSGILKSGALKPYVQKIDNDSNVGYAVVGAVREVNRPADSGGASRFFYIAKANKRDRNEGLDGLPLVKGGSMNGAETRPDKPTNHPVRQNFHPTVKPTDLMRQLIRLVTPLGGVVLDPFTGSGSTGKAAILEGMQFIGCELTPDYLPIIEGRINWAVEQVKQDKLKAEQESAEVLF